MSEHATRVLFVTSGGLEQASSRLRVFNLVEHLPTEEFDVEVIWPHDVRLPGPEVVRKGYFVVRLLAKATRCDVLYLQKRLLPAPLVSLLASIVPTFVYDLDDAMYATPHWKDEDDQTKIGTAETILDAADMVVAGSPQIRDYAAQFTDDSEVLLPSLPFEPYRERRGIDHGDVNSVTIGWIGNPENLRYLATIESELGDVLDAHDDACLLVITAGDFPVEPLVDRDDVEYREWSLETQLDDLQEADVSIRPLTDDEWTRSKGGFVSVIQPMALGIPVVVTPVGLLSEIVVHGETGFHAETSSDWTEYLGRLVQDDELRREMGERARAAVDEWGFWAHQRADDLTALLRRISPTTEDTVGQNR